MYFVIYKDIKNPIAKTDCIFLTEQIVALNKEWWVTTEDENLKIGHRKPVNCPILKEWLCRESYLTMPLSFADKTKWLITQKHLDID